MRGPQPSFLQWPNELAGFEDEQAVDPATNMIYAFAHIIPQYMGYFGLNASTYFTSTGEGGVACPSCGTILNNGTVWGIDINSGTVKWHNTISTFSGYRGQGEVSGNVVYAGANSQGDIKMYDATTGALLRDYYIGAPMDVGLSIGAAVNGQQYILMPVGTCGNGAVSTCPGSTPGDIVALTLQNVPPASASTTTVTTTSTTTSVTTTTLPGQTITTTTTLPGGQVVTTTITGTATTVTISGSGTVTTTTTTTTTTTSGGGVSSTALYGVAAVAVIFIIATGYLAMRGRKPAS